MLLSRPVLETRSGAVGSTDSKFGSYAPGPGTTLALGSSMPARMVVDAKTAFCIVSAPLSVTMSASRPYSSTVTVYAVGAGVFSPSFQFDRRKLRMRSAVAPKPIFPA